MTFKTLVDESIKLKLDDLEAFIDLLKNAARDRRRDQIRRDALKGRADRKAGKKMMTLDKLNVKTLRNQFAPKTSSAWPFGVSAFRVDM